MSLIDFNATYPTLCRLLTDSSFDTDVTEASTLDQVGLRDALKESKFKLNELMWLLCENLGPPRAGSGASELESNLVSIVQAVGFEAARHSYRNKLLVNDEKTFEDTRYEIAVTAKACAALDVGTVELEKPIADPTKEPWRWKNSDISGTYQTKPVRIEVTVLHENFERVDLGLVDVVKGAQISSGFRITLRSVIADKGYAERLRALIELLHECHLSSGGRNEEIDCVRFEWRGGHARKISAICEHFLLHGRWVSNRRDDS